MVTLRLLIIVWLLGYQSCIRHLLIEPRLPNSTVHKPKNILLCHIYKKKSVK